MESIYFVLTNMEKDKRYKDLRYCFNSGRAKTFSDMFSVSPYTPKTILTNDMRYHNTKMNRMISNPEEFSIVELCDVCDQIEIEPKAFILMILNNYLPIRYNLKK